MTTAGGGGPRQRRGRLAMGAPAAAGVTIGLLGWLLGLAAVCVSTGHADLLVAVVPAGLALTAGLALATVVVLECMLRLAGRGRLVTACLWGMLLVDVGALWLHANHAVMPRIAERPDLLETLERLGGAPWTGDGVPLAALAAGVVLLGSVAVGLTRRPAAT